MKASRSPSASETGPIENGPFWKEAIVLELWAGPVEAYMERTSAAASYSPDAPPAPALLLKPPGLNPSSDSSPVSSPAVQLDRDRRPAVIHGRPHCRAARRGQGEESPSPGSRPRLVSPAAQLFFFFLVFPCDSSEKYCV